MRLLVTGASGFLGTNLIRHVRAAGVHEAVPVTRRDRWPEIDVKLSGANFVIHLAGTNRVKHDDEYRVGNVGLTERLIEAMKSTRHRPPILLASSIQAVDTQGAYGRSKRDAEKVVAGYVAQTRSVGLICRFPNLFGPHGRPNYNSVVATFCYNASRSLPMVVVDADRELRLAYVDDAIGCVMQAIEPERKAGVHRVEVGPVNSITVGRLAELIGGFRDGGAPPGEKLGQMLHATYEWYVTEGHVFDG